MKHALYTKLAHQLVTYSTNVQKGENVLIDAVDVDSEILEALIVAITSRGGNPFVNIYNSKIQRALYINASEKTWEHASKYELEFMKTIHAYIALRGGNNSFEYSDVPSVNMKAMRKLMHPVIDQRVKHTKWCVLRWPNGAMAQASNMSTEAFEEFFFNVCTMDYSRMKNPSDALVALMNKTDKVKLVGPGVTNIEFSIKNIPAIACIGTMNIPDGEVFTAPIKDSINGIIQYNTPTAYDGKKFENILLEFNDGKIISSTSSDTKSLNEILDTDDGSRFVGEFAIGFNPYVTKAMCDILFDEKIAGSIHLTPGACYDEASNGNVSNIHWDMVMIQTPEYGGGQIFFDDVLIRDNGIFVIPELKGLNPEELKNG